MSSFPMKEFAGFQVPEINREKAVERFNNGGSACKLADCLDDDFDCEKCIFNWKCEEFEGNEEAALAFAKMARFCGYKITRAGIKYNKKTGNFEVVK